MNRNKQTFLSILVLSSLAAVLSGCPIGGSSSSTTRLHTVTEYSVPDKVTANATFDVEVALAPAAITLSPPQSAGSGGAAYSGTRQVRLIDVNPPGAPIDCGSAQPVTVGAGAVVFTCSAPQTMLYGSNEHTLKIRVPNTTDPVDTASVEVINDGRVNDQITDVYGNPITQATPGQTVLVAFSSTSSPQGEGMYTVNPPEGWAVSGNSTCTLPSGAGDNCKVSMKIPIDEPIGVTDYVQLSPWSGASRLENKYFPVDITQYGSVTSLGATVGGGLKFEYAQNIADTVYANVTGKKQPTFIYNVKYTFENTSGNSLDIGSAKTLGLSGVKYECGGTSYSSVTSCSPLGSLQYLTVSGKLDNTLDARNPVRTRTVYAKLYDTGNALLAQGSNKNIYLADYYPGHVAIRLVNPTKSPTILAAYDGGKNSMIAFDSSGVGSVPAQATGLKFKSYSYAIDTTATKAPASKTRDIPGTVFYMPYAISGKLYLARTKNKFTLQGAPSVTASPTEPPYVVIEPTYSYNVSSGKSCKWITPSKTDPCENLTIDLSYVNSMAILAKINAIGNAGIKDSSGSVMSTQDVTFGAVKNITTSNLFKNVKSVLDKVKKDGTGPKDLPWPKLVGYIDKSRGVIRWIVAPISLSQVAALDPFPKNYYNAYVDKLWIYYSTHPMRIEAAPVGSASGGLRSAATDTCVVQGAVTGTGANAELVFHKESGTCPYGYAIAGLPGMAKPGTKVCGTNKNEYCRDTPDIAFGRFNDCDFFQATGSGGCHQYNGKNVDATSFFENKGLWGPNGTYRSVIGRAIAAYQAAGLLPQSESPPNVELCDTSASPPAMTSANAAAIVDYQVKTSKSLSSTPCLSGLSIPTYNVYASALLQYVDVYTYSYSDFLGRDGTVSFAEQAYNSGTKFPPPLPRAQPVTIILK